MNNLKFMATALLILIAPAVFSTPLETADDVGERASQIAPYNEEELMAKSYAEMKKSEVRWLWKDRIPLGALTVLDGDPGQFKSQLTIDLASRVTTGSRMACGAEGIGPGGALLINFEDDPASVIYPRLELAGADVSRVFDIRDEVPDGVVQFPRDLAVVERLILDREIKVIVIDPLSAAIADGGAMRESAIRSTLGALLGLAGADHAVLAVRHLTKNGRGKAIHRGAGSNAILALARSGLVVAPDPQTDGVRYASGHPIRTERRRSRPGRFSA